MHFSSEITTTYNICLTWGKTLQHIIGTPHNLAHTPSTRAGVVVTMGRNIQPQPQRGGNISATGGVASVSSCGMLLYSSALHCQLAVGITCRCLYPEKQEWDILSPTSLRQKWCSSTEHSPHHTSSNS